MHHPDHQGVTPNMAQNLYVATMEPSSGKSLVVLGIMELLSRRVQKLGFFRPLIRATGDLDNDIELVRRRYCPDLAYESLYAVTQEEAQRLIAAGEQQELLNRIFTGYRAVEKTCEFVVCEGTDFASVASAFEFDFNARVARHLGCPVLLVTVGRGKSPVEILELVRTAREGFAREGCAILATVINRVDAAFLGDLAGRLGPPADRPSPVYIVPEVDALARPTVGQIAEALGGSRLLGGDAGLDREVRNYKIAAMHLGNFLTYVEEGSLIITPGDRADVILASIATFLSEGHPKIAGIILSGGLDPDPEVMRLIRGFRRAAVPVFRVDTDTFTTATRAQRVLSVIAPGDDRKVATALGVFEAHVDKVELERHIAVARPKRLTPLMFEYELVERARENRQHIVLPEGSDERILRAADILLRRGVVDLTLLGSIREIRERVAELGLEVEGARLVDPAESAWHEPYAQAYHELRRHKGVNEDIARDRMLDVSYFGTMMVHRGAADGMVSGAVHTTGHTIRPALEIIRTRPGCAIVSSVFFMCLGDRVLVYGDCAVNPDPNPVQLADIAVTSAATAAMFGVEPRVAMLSYSTGESGKGAEVDKVREATRIARQLRPDLKIEGPIQYDAAVDPTVAALKMPGSDVAGRATVFIFPDLNTGNNTYKAVQRSAGAGAFGPVLQGLKKPVNDLSRGCAVADVVNTVAITAIQAQEVGI